MRALAILLFCLLAAITAQAQIYRFKIYNTGTGLPNNAVYSILQDSKGYIWFATNNGACRYDGLNYQIFTTQQGLADNPVRGIIEDKQGQIWILTRGGISRYDGKQFTNYTTAQGLAENEIRSGLCARDGTLWFGSAKGLSRFDGEKFINYDMRDGLPTGPVWAMKEGRNGSLWLAIRGGGLAKYDGKKFTAYGAEQGLIDANIFSLAFDQQGGLWLAADGGLSYYNGSEFRHYSEEDGLANTRVSTIVVDRLNRVWCGTYGGGISRLEGERFVTFNRNNGLPDNYVISGLQDQEGNLWWGTQRSGGFIFPNEMFTSYTAATGIGDGVISGISEASDGTLWFSSLSTGLTSKGADNQLRRFGVKDGLMEEELWYVYADSQGRVWTSGHKGVSCYHQNKFTNYTLEQVGIRTRITTIMEDGNGRIWFGSDTATSNGISIYDGEKFSHYSTNEGLANNQVNSFALDREGRVWICTEGGLSRFDDGKFFNITRADGLPNKYVQRFYQDEQGTIWLGLSGGLCRYEQGKFTLYTTNDGLIDNSIRALISKDNLLWIGTLRGIATFDGKQFRNYTSRNGLISDSITMGLKLRSDGSLWFGTTEGAVRYQPVVQNVIPKAPIVHITGLRLEDQVLELNRATSLAYYQNSITFDFVGLSFIDESAVRFSYQLENFDRKWSAPDNSRTARFTNIPPGRYRLMVKAGAGEFWSDAQVFEFEIRAPYWQTWWFRLSLFLGLLGIAFLIYDWRIRRLKRRHQERIDELRKLLNSIQVINSRLDLETVLQNIAAESARLIAGEPGGIGLIENDRLVFRRVWLKDRWDECELVFQLGEGVAGTVATSAQPMIVNDPPANSTLAFPTLIEKYYVYGFMDVPIITRSGKVVGVLDVRRPKGRGPFTDSDRKLIESLANQAAVAIENAGLYGELATLYQNERAMTRRLQELDEMKTTFMIITSHEMRTPLTILKGYHDLMLDKYLDSLNGFPQRSLKTCQRTVDRLIVIVNDILEMLKINEGYISINNRACDLKIIVDETLEDLNSFITQREQQLKIEIPEQLPMALADPEKIRLILLNLLQNAIKFTPDGGELSLKIKFDDNSENLLIAIADTGIGIDETELEKIFDKFYTGADPLHHSSGKYEFGARGTGLGLAIAKKYVEAQGGRIWAESAGAGKGSCFYFQLPTIKIAAPV